MDPRLDLMLEAMRTEFARQAEDGNATYNGVATDGLDALEGYFDLGRVARAALTALDAQPSARANRPDALGEPPVLS